MCVCALYGVCVHKSFLISWAHATGNVTTHEIGVRHMLYNNGGGIFEAPLMHIHLLSDEIDAILKADTGCV